YFLLDSTIATTTASQWLHSHATSRTRPTRGCSESGPGNTHRLRNGIISINFTISECILSAAQRWSDRQWRHRKIYILRAGGDHRKLLHFSCGSQGLRKGQPVRDLHARQLEN